jgi:hypothetical protein
MLGLIAAVLIVLWLLGLFAFHVTTHLDIADHISSTLAFAEFVSHGTCSALKFRRFLHQLPRI